MGIKQNTQQAHQETAKSKSSGTVQKASRQVADKPSFFQRARAYFEAAYVELGKVSWPTWKEVKATGLAVAALVLVMSLFLGVVDLLLSSTVASILSLGS